MSQFRREYFELKQAEALDIADPRSFAVHRKSQSRFLKPEYRPRKTFCTLHSNRNCSECKKKKALAPKRRRHRKLGMDLLANDLYGFSWIDPKVNEYQSLTVSGKSIDTGVDFLEHTGGVRFQNNRLFFPELSLSRPLLVTEQAGIYRRQPREGKESLKNFEDKEWKKDNLRGFEESVEVKERLPDIHVKQSLNIGSSSEMKVLESCDNSKRRINVFLPRIS